MFDLYAYARQNRPAILFVSFAVVAAIALADWWVQPHISLGLLYVFPILIGAVHLGPAAVIALGTLCAVLREWFGPYDLDLELAPRVVIMWIAYCGSGLLVVQIVRTRTILERAHQDLAGMIESSPLPVLIAGENGSIASANRAAQAIFSAPESELRLKEISQLVPALAAVPVRKGAPIPRTMVECRANRTGGASFPARVWFSVYGGAGGTRLAAVVLDTSEDFREREEAEMESLLSTSRILISAVFHEIRNGCIAIRSVAGRLTAVPGVRESPDYQSMLNLIASLEELAGLRLELSTTAPGHTALDPVLADLQTILGPLAADQDVTVVWNLEPALPRVRAERRKLLQALLNIVKNSLAALEKCSVRRIEVAARREGEFVQIAVHDSGSGIADEGALFRPFTSGAGSAGLGLYVSRAVVRSFGGDLFYDRAGAGARFIVRLLPAGEPACRR